MKYVAHRVFRDGETFDGFDAGRLDGYHGVELDIREDGRGGVCINHAPVFRRARADVDLSGRGLDDAVAVFAENCSSLEMLFLDVKTSAAAAILAARIARRPLGYDSVFLCWHHAEIAAIRSHLPHAVIFFCVAPIFAARARTRSVYVTNSFPFVSRTTRFNPDAEKPNRHSINVQLIARRAPEVELPDAIDGVCVHRIFRSTRLENFIAGRGLMTAFYGLPSRAHPRTQALAGLADYAIIRKEKPQPAAVVHSHERAA